MKKLIAILTIAIVLVSAVFAASENHTLKIQAEVGTVVPAFQLQYGNTSNKTNETPTVFANSASYDPFDAAAIDTSIALDEGGVVTVKAILANAAKIVKMYTLHFQDGVFTVNRNTVSGTLVPTIATTAGTAGTGIATIAKASEAADADVNVTFNGTTATASQILATATYTYAADTAIDPGTYVADIVLVISTT